MRMRLSCSYEPVLSKKLINGGQQHHCHVSIHNCIGKSEPWLPYLLCNSQGIVENRRSLQLKKCKQSDPAMNPSYAKSQ
jgi:hypothetical protein